jgi:hypothetical protein
MSYISRLQLEALDNLVQPGKVVVLYGPRRVGKTTLLQHYLAESHNKADILNGDDISIREYLSSQSIIQLKSFVGNRKLLVIDEAQNIPNIGLNLKLLVDHMPDLSIIATGSSSFELARDIGEPLTGRKYTLQLYPIAQVELQQQEGPHEVAANLPLRLIYGSYPEVVTMQDNQQRARYLQEMVSSYLFKDILALEDIRHSDKLVRLLQLIAMQLGKDVSTNELATQLGLSKNTVARYLDLLQKTFVIFSRPGFSRNLRKEISKSQRYYFYDNGIRNALLANFNDITLREDLGALWENYIIYERMKLQEYRGELINRYFWRTYQQQEIDLVEEQGGKLSAFEIKWQNKRVKVPSSWKDTYTGASFNAINRENYLDFIL